MTRIANEATDEKRETEKEQEPVHEQPRRELLLAQRSARLSRHGVGTHLARPARGLRRQRGQQRQRKTSRVVPSRFANNDNDNDNDSNRGDEQIWCFSAEHGLVAERNAPNRTDPSLSCEQLSTTRAVRVRTILRPAPVAADSISRVGGNDLSSGFDHEILLTPANDAPHLFAARSILSTPRNDGVDAGPIPLVVVPRSMCAVRDGTALLAELPSTRCWWSTWWTSSTWFGTRCETMSEPRTSATSLVPRRSRAREPSRRDRNNTELPILVDASYHHASYQTTLARRKLEELLADLSRRAPSSPSRRVVESNKHDAGRSRGRGTDWRRRACARSTRGAERVSRGSDDRAR